VEAGESLGFLPGDLQDKINPYLRPLYDAMNAVLPREVVHKLTEHGIIEIAPLAYMRGRTLTNCAVILDEAQNTTTEQMKMFLTRMGEGSKVFVTGDVTQIDLPKKKASGLVHALRVLAPIDEIGRIQLTDGDVVRSSLVRKIVQAYEHEQDEY
jgi:phosphate starvation-inducible PhoH-like protein